MSTLILGNGFCGGYLKSILSDAECTQLPDLVEGSDISFDFDDTDTWKNIEGFDTYIFTFKMADPQNALLLNQLTQGSQRIFLSSARCFENFLPDEVIDEKTSLKNTLRNQCESIFLPNACLLHLGLIWGGDRDPQRWITEGRIKNGRKHINMIHLFDIGNVVKSMVAKDLRGRYLVSDGISQKWSKLAAKIKLELPEFDAGLGSRIFETKKLQASLVPNYRFQLF